MIIVFSKASGRISNAMEAPDFLADGLKSVDFDTIIIDSKVNKDIQTDTYHVDVESRQLIKHPPKPSQYHIWDWANMAWKVNIIDDARSDVKLKLSSERVKLSLLPCNNFDANTLARANISGAIARLTRGDGLPDGWVGWRDANNEMHWTTDDTTTALEGLSVLARAIEDRDQYLFVRMWQKKAEIDSLQTIDEILSYDTSL